ncbi:MGMT family protein [Halobacillus litoralis]|uniref:DNA methyltransferase n=1 Tax=Halobacillus litoralis TaxID=45668 RepID=A0A410MEL0_9BACI|nr:MGMT family protein [Halobacillus litoralis]QAS53153.1 DNA methyltransferase [Halobacillus litoralis]
MKPFTQKTIQIIKNIPPGKVMTYGQVAQWAGNPRSARQVARILHTMSRKHKLPWHRVLNAQGQISIKDESLAEIQKISLQAEGITVINYKIQLGQYLLKDELYHEDTFI